MVRNNLVPGVRFPLGQHQEHGLWPDPKQEVRESQTSDSPTQTQKFETMVVVNGLLEWTFTANAHQLEMARVRVLGADQKESWLWGRNCGENFSSRELRLRKQNPKKAWDRFWSQGREMLAPRPYVTDTFCPLGLIPVHDKAISA